MNKTVAAAAAFPLFFLCVVANSLAASGDIQAGGGGSSGNSNTATYATTAGNANTANFASSAATSVTVTGNANHLVLLPPGTLLATNGSPLAGSTGDANNASQNVYLGVPDPNALLAGSYGIFIGVGNGYYGPSTSQEQIAIGDYTRTEGRRCLAVGTQSSCLFDLGSAVGVGAVAGYEGSSFGGLANTNSIVAAQGSAFGWQANGSGYLASAFGSASVATGDQSSAFGRLANCAGNNDSCFGTATSCPVTFVNSTAIGQSATCTASNQLVLGASTTAVFVPGTFSTPALSLGALNAAFSGTVSVPSTSSYSWVSRTKLLSPVDGTLQVTTSAGAFGTLLLGAAGSATGMQFVASSGKFVVANGAGTSAGIQAGGFLGTSALSLIPFQNANASNYGFGFADATHTSVYTNGTLALNIDSAQNAVMGGNLTVSGATLQVGPSTSAGVVFTPGVSNVLSLTSGSGGAIQLKTYLYVAQAASGGSFFSTSLGAASSPAFTSNTLGTSGMYFPSTTQLGFSTNGIAALTLDANQNAVVGGNVTLPHAALDTNGMMVPAQINAESYYWSEEFIGAICTSPYLTSGTVSCNPTSTPGAITASTVGVLQTSTTSATLGGGVSGGSAIPAVKSTAITYQWRSMFYLPTASTSTNRYTAYIGAINSNTANSSYTPYGGPYIKYSDNVNSGNWVIGSAVGAVQTTANAAVAATNGWHKLAITLANGTFTYVLDGTTLGTVTDTNILTTVVINALAPVFGAVIVPDGTNWTSAQYLTVDRADFYMTGMSR